MVKILSLPEYIELVKLLRLDVYFLFFVFGFMIPGVTISQFVQDKFCLNQLKLDQQVCLHLEKLGPEYEDVKNQVYASATTFKNYQTLISTPPGFILSFFMGYWIDSYPGHLKYLLALPCFGGSLSIALMIYNAYYFEMNVMQLLWTSVIHGLSGGFFIVMTGSYTYITRRTPAKYRAARFAILELFMFASMPFATAIGGKILTMKPWFPGQLRNYLAVFLIGLVSKLIAMVWILIFLYDADQPIIEEEEVGKPEVKVDDGAQPNDKINGISVVEAKMEEIELQSKEKEMMSEADQVKEKAKPTGFIPILVDIFNPTTVVNMIRTCCRRRENNKRKILWNLMMAMDVMLIGHLGESIIGFPFAQKVYHWDAGYYSYVHSVIMIVPSIANTLLPIILIHKFHLDDTVLAIIGGIALISALILKGGILEAWAYFVSVFIGMPAGLLPIAIRSMISRIIDSNEVGQVYALLACIESAGPMFSSVFYSTLFKLTIENFPGMVHHVVALTMFYPFLVVLWLDLTKHKWDPTVIKKDLANQNNNNKSSEKTANGSSSIKEQSKIFEKSSKSTKTSDSVTMGNYIPKES